MDENILDEAVDDLDDLLDDALLEVENTTAIKKPVTWQDTLSFLSLEDKLKTVKMIENDQRKQNKVDYKKRSYSPMYSSWTDKSFVESWLNNSKELNLASTLETLLLKTKESMSTKDSAEKLDKLTKTCKAIEKSLILQKALKLQLKADVTRRVNAFEIDKQVILNDKRFVSTKTLLK